MKGEKSTRADAPPSSVGAHDVAPGMTSIGWPAPSVKSEALPSVLDENRLEEIIKKTTLPSSVHRPVGPDAVSCVSPQAATRPTSRRMTEHVAVIVENGVTSHIVYFLRDQRRQVNRNNRITSQAGSQRDAERVGFDWDSDDVPVLAEIRWPRRKFGKGTKGRGSFLGSPSKRARAVAAGN